MKVTKNPSLDIIEQEIRIKHGELNELYNKRQAIAATGNATKKAKKTNLKNIDLSTFDLTLDN